MNHNNLLLSLPFDCETAMLLVIKLLKSEGLSPQRTFDLRSACASFTDPVCPHHGDLPCRCQLIVYLVHSEHPPPVALIGHGYDNQTEIYQDNLPGQRPSSEIEIRIRNALHGQI